MWPTVAGPATPRSCCCGGQPEVAALGTLLSAGTVAFMADIGSREVVPGANDNGTGCVASDRPARSIAERPLESTRVLFVHLRRGPLRRNGLFMERPPSELPRESTFFLCLDTIGSPSSSSAGGGC